MFNFKVMKTNFIFLLVVLFGSINANAGELFLRVNGNGNYTVKIFNQSQENGNRIYKFFDLPGGNNNLVVLNSYNHSMIYNKTIQIGQNERVIAELNQNGYLTIVQRMYIQVVNWFTTQENIGGYNGNYGGNYNGNYGNNNWGNNNQYGNNGMDSQSFNQFLALMEDESFDSNRLTMAKNYAKSGNLTVNQIRQIMLKFSFDSSRLDFGKAAYNTCVDRNNYVLLKDAFTMTSNYNSLMKYVNGE